MAQKLKEALARLMYYWNPLKGLWERFERWFSCYKSPRHIYEILATGTTFDWEGVIYEGHVLTRYVLELGDTTNNVTRTLSIIDENGVTIWSGAAHADAGNNSVPVDVELAGRYRFRLTLSGAAGNVVYDYLTLFVR